MNESQQDQPEQTQGDEAQAAEAPDALAVDDARELLAAGDADVFDLRGADERAEGYVPGSAGIEADELLSRELPDDRRVIVVCGNGERSSEVAAKLREQGTPASHLDGGMDKWESERLPVQPSPDMDEGEDEPPKLPGAGV